MIRLLLADDHVFVRMTLMEMFAATDDIEVVAECADGDEAVVEAERTRPDVLLLDLWMPKRTGLEAARAVLERDPGARILLLTGNLSSAALEEAQSVGLAGYLLKGESSTELIEHVRTVAHGGSVWLGNSVPTR